MKKAIIFLTIFNSLFVGALTVLTTKTLQMLIDFPKMDLVFRLAIFWIATSCSELLNVYITGIFFVRNERTHIGRILNKISRLPFLLLETQKYSDDLNEVKAYMERDYIHSLRSVVSAIVSAVGLYFVVFGYLNQMYIFMLYIMLFAYLFFAFFVSKKHSKLMYNYWQEYILNTRKYNYYTGVLTEGYAYKDKKVFNFSTYFSSLFDKEFETAAEKNKVLGKHRLKLEFYIDCAFFVYLLTSSVLMLCAYKFHGISLGLFISTVSYLVSSSDTMIAAMKAIETLSRYSSHCKKISCFMHQEEDVTMIGSETVNDEKQILSVENVFFKYPNGEQFTIDNITFCLQKGKKYAIVGANGSGKTTLVKLLVGLYNPSAGVIVNEIQPIALFQDFNRYPMTLAENIALKEVDAANENNIDMLVNTLGMKKKIDKMEKGIYTELTTTKVDGQDLSGGEWQRIGLARLLFAESEIYLLDEPTASLDPLEEVKFFQTYNEMLSDKTVVFITHRLGFVKNVDEILVLNEGRIVEKGSHDYLMAQERGLYRKMYEEQRCWYE